MVSKQMNHLLKSPLVVHPLTGRVCVPLDPSKVEQFEPEKVPTVVGLLKEIDEMGKERGEKAYLETSLREYVEMFDKFLKGLMLEVKKENVQNVQKTNDTLFQF